MERTLNRVELRGNVGSTPKITKLGNGSMVIRFSLATNETFKTKEGVLKEETMWHNVVAWSSKNLPEFESIKKGTFVDLIGKIKYGKYTTQSGEEKYTTDIVAQKISLIEVNSA